jgi:hypothetical protein
LSIADRLIGSRSNIASFQTSAALETYLKLLIESWAQALRNHNLGTALPDRTRGFLAAKRFEQHFVKYAYLSDETALSSAIANEHRYWAVLNANPALPNFFDGKAIHSGSAYPTLKNIKRLFARTGLDGIDGKLGGILRRDVEAMIEGFQSIRTALAHSAPPSVTMKDVRRLIEDMIKLAGAIDRIFFSHVSRHGGLACWSAPALPAAAPAAGGGP